MDRALAENPTTFRIPFSQLLERFQGNAPYVILQGFGVLYVLWIIFQVQSVDWMFLKQFIGMRSKEAWVELKKFVILRGQGDLDCLNFKPLEVVRGREVRLKVFDLLNEGLEKCMRLSLCFNHFEVLYGVEKENRASLTDIKRNKKRLWLK